MAGEKILLVDDDPQLRETLQEFLAGQGYAVTAAADGHEAMAALQDQEFALALLDLMLPGRSGLDLLSHIKAHTPDTEVILFTGHAGLESAVQALRLGAYDYLMKADLRLADLQALVARALERRRLARENRELVDNISQSPGRTGQPKGPGADPGEANRRNPGRTPDLGPAHPGAGQSHLGQLPPGTAGSGNSRAPKPELPLSSFRRQPDVPDADVSNLSGLAARASWRLTPPPLPPGRRSRPCCGRESRWSNVTLVAGAGRHEPFTPEEAELFRIFILQGEAGIKNLVLFDQVKSMAIRDALTGLYNYGYFKETLHYEVEKSRRYNTPLSLLFLDIDDFKQVNDTLGHLKGDKIMRQVAAILKRGIRQADLLCRYGGDEFVMLLSQTPPEQAMVLAERLRQTHCPVFHEPAGTRPQGYRQYRRGGAEAGDEYGGPDKRSG